MASVTACVGTWHAVANHTGKSVEVHGFERADGYQAKLKGAELLGVKPEHVRVEWVPEAPTGASP